MSDTTVIRVRDALGNIVSETKVTEPLPFPLKDGQTAEIIYPPPPTPQPQHFPNGITSPRLEATDPVKGLVVTDADGNKYAIAAVARLPVVQQISASPERDKEEIKAKLHEVERKLNIAKAKRDDAEVKRRRREDDEKKGKKPNVNDVLSEILDRLDAIEEIIKLLSGEPLT